MTVFVITKKGDPIWRSQYSVSDSVGSTWGAPFVFLLDYLVHSLERSGVDVHEGDWIIEGRREA